MIIDPDDPVLCNFKAKYAHVHPLVFHRSVERAKSFLNLFEIMEALPKDCPFSWSDSVGMWVRDDDMMAFDSLDSIKKKGRK